MGIKKSSRTIGSQLVFSQNPKFKNFKICSTSDKKLKTDFESSQKAPCVNF
jgi:hypothetical protein